MPAPLPQHPAAPDRRKSAFVSTIRDQSGEDSEKKIGEILKKEGQITAHQLDEALEVQKKQGGRIGAILFRLGYIEEDTIPKILSRQYGFSPIYLEREKIDQKAINLVDYQLAKKYFLFPISVVGSGNLKVTMSEPTNTKGIEEVQAHTRLKIEAGVSTELEIAEAYKKYYKIDEAEYKSLGVGKVEEVEESTISMAQIDDFGSLASEAAENFSIEAVRDDEDSGGGFSADDAPIIKLVNGLLFKAVQGGISDIHIEPFEKSFYVRYRLDGALFKTMNLPMSIKNALISRFKILANLDITERRVPQDGRIKLKLGRNKDVDFRVSTLPTLFGESIVLRILDKSALHVDLTKMGFNATGFERFMKAIDRPYGMVLVTGPTGSGKTTTLYSALDALNKEDVKILTAEDPVEFNFKGINQVLVRSEVGMTFAAALKAFLRQDPDIIMLGEIRDLETAEIAVKAAMTGHLVFSTLHTNDCPGTINRLIDIGIPPYMVAAAVTLVLSQRLLRRICPKCKEPIKNVSAAKLREAGFLEAEFPNLQLFQGKGCSHCNGTGYKGRVGVFEIMEIDEILQEAITSNVGESQLRKIAIKSGMDTLRRDALNKAMQGHTTLDEVLKKTVIQKESLPAYLLSPDEQIYENGDIVIKEGNTDKSFYKLIQGCLEVIKGGRKIGEISQPDEYFGEMNALLNETRSATIRSKGKSIVKVFPGEKLQETLANYPEIANKMIVSLAKRLEVTNKMLIDTNRVLEQLRQARPAAPQAQKAQ
ncbi:MAG: type IV-A pilus assembly ATPase PilB [Deltaproteobacteria bacterium]|nr:type IV-A pilus assembly ATPase PilB [Deltaproteobacteria bacterium]